MGIPLFWFGILLALLAAIAAALNFTAVPAVMNVPMAVVFLASSAILALGIWLVLELRRRRFGLRRISIVAMLLVTSALILSTALFRDVLSFDAADVHFSSGGVRLAGTVFSPRLPGPHPGIVFVHGSGPETRKEYAFYAKLLARENIEGLAFDKRGSGKSTGNLYEATYGDYASDVLAAVDYLKREKDVVANCIGLMGVSEGEWVASLAATRSADIAFLVVVAPSGVSPSKQVDEEIAFRLRARGYSEDTVVRAILLNDRVFEYQRNGSGKDSLQRDLERARSERWFRDARKIPEQLYPLSEYAWWRSVMDFTPASVWEKVKVPVLLLKGGRDPLSDPAIARKEIETAMAKGGNSPPDFVLFPDGEHVPIRWPLGDHIPPPLFANGYLDTLRHWIAHRTCASRQALSTR